MNSPLPRTLQYSCSGPVFITPPGRPACRLFWRCCHTLLLILFFLLPPDSCPGAQKAGSADIETYRNQPRRLEQKIQEQQQAKEAKTKDEINLLGELESLDRKLNIQQQKVNDLNVKVQLQQMLIDLKQGEIDTLADERRELLEHLRNRSAAYYKMGKVGFLNVAFSSRSLPDLLKFHDAFQTLITYDKNIIIDYRQKIDTLQSARDAHALEMKVLEDFIAEEDRERETIDLIRAEKEQLLAHIRSEKHLHEKAAAEMRAASEELAQTLVSLKTDERIQERTFQNSKGKLHVPVPGRVITYFNQEKFNRLGVLRKSQGIAISAPDGARVEAVADGTVIFAGYLRGYGNTVIIHHGYQYYTITSRIEEIAVKEGEHLRRGASIGVASETAALIDEGVYFEIRHGKDSKDPLAWLDLKMLEHSKHLQELNRG